MELVVSYYKKKMTKNLLALQKLLISLEEAKSSEDLALALGSAILLISKELKETKEDTSKLDELRKELEEAIEKIELQKGDDGKTPTEKELLDLMYPLIPDPIPGEPGDDYVLTEKDKKEIAEKIEVPIVEKVIEKTETIIREQPLITEITKEVAVAETPEQIRNKLELLQGEERLDKKAVKGLDEEFKKLGEQILNIPRGGGVSALGVRQAMKSIFHTQAPVGAIDGANLTYTVSNDIWAIISFTLNGESIAQLPNYTFANKTITFTTALPVDYATRDFEVKYFG